MNFVIVKLNKTLVTDTELNPLFDSLYFASSDYAEWSFYSLCA